MTKSILTLITQGIAASGMFAALAIAQPAPHYIVTDLGTLGGTYSYGYGINNAGWVGGGAATVSQTGGVAQTAFLWHGGQMTNLGTLGGPSSEVGGGPNLFDEVSIISETSVTDPNGEDFCGFGTHLQCLGAIWKNGTMAALPTLPGGNNGQAYWLNDEGQVSGFAENGTPDSTCVAPFQVLRFEAVIWGPKGEIRELRPLKGDTVGFAFGINDKGQVAGTSGLCSNTTPGPVNPGGPHAVLWESDGSAIDLGNLGSAPNDATSVNDRGEVVGTAQSPEDGTLHTFLWTQDTGMQDLGAFPGAVVTVAPCCHTLNNRGEVVGFSIDGTTFSSRALVWQGKVPKDLNDFIPAGSPWYLQWAASINDAGEIVGWGTINGEVHAFLATPR